MTEWASKVPHPSLYSRNIFSTPALPVLMLVSEITEINQKLFLLSSNWASVLSYSHFSRLLEGKGLNSPPSFPNHLLLSLVQGITKTSLMRELLIPTNSGKKLEYPFLSLPISSHWTKSQVFRFHVLRSLPRTSQSAERKEQGIVAPASILSCPEGCKLRGNTLCPHSLENLIREPHPYQTCFPSFLSDS